MIGVLRHYTPVLKKKKLFKMHNTGKLHSIAQLENNDKIAHGPDEMMFSSKKSN